ncbi:cupredoxin domain-containing protein [Gorillibacterium sp. sgz5001074]|uniref:cupredoxin domain-containing protein n=1 Tax=Gorillibacterium sp. sgz5001074 TaxID=3446695 RepID=UPI003F67E5BE
MARVIVVKRKVLHFISAAFLLLAGTIAYYSWTGGGIEPVGGLPEGDRVIHMVTGEFESTTADGRKIEAYGWNPGTVFVEKDEKVKLVLYGVNGESHPFYIEGTTIKGEVRKGKETVVPFQSSKEGTYRIICLTHMDKDHSGPMIGYIVVD